MKKGTKVLIVFTFFVLVIAILHSMFHFYIFGTGISGFSEKGVVGFSIGQFSVGEEKTGQYNIGVSLSQLLVLLEWSAVLIFFVFVYVRNKVDFKREVFEIENEMKKIKSSNKTDIDMLYEILKVKKRMSFAVIANIFGVKEQVVKGWAKILESSNLAAIDYPRIGGTELVISKKISLEK